METSFGDFDSFYALFREVSEALCSMETSSALSLLNILQVVHPVSEALCSMETWPWRKPYPNHVDDVSLFQKHYVVWKPTPPRPQKRSSILNLFQKHYVVWKRKAKIKSKTSKRLIVSEALCSMETKRRAFIATPASSRTTSFRSTM